MPSIDAPLSFFDLSLWIQIAEMLERIRREKEQKMMKKIIKMLNKLRIKQEQENQKAWVEQVCANEYKPTPTDDTPPPLMKINHSRD
jgi:hypothetical protein